jgi:decaprenylphospho-beta-D-erythro-pentofuranosid-2-ulose 2-reductase
MPTVLVLGASSDMAMAIARKFAKHGYNIQLAARNTSQLTHLQSDISIRYGSVCTLHAFDATQYDTHQHFFDLLPVKPDITITVFGYLGDNETARKNWQESLAIINTNYTGAVSILNIVSGYYAAQRNGVIVGISSVAGERGRQSNYMYGSAKAGFTAYLSGLRNRMVQENVHVVTVLPGFANTRMTENMKLPPLLTAQPAEIGDAVYHAAINRKNTIYVKWMWRWIMLIIKLIPEPVFKKMKL